MAETIKIEFSTEEIRNLLTVACFAISLDTQLNLTDNLKKEIFELIPKLKKAGFKRKPKLPNLKCDINDIKVDEKLLKDILVHVDLAT